MVALHGSIGEFHPDKEEWTSYIERLESYFVANDVPSAKKDTLFSICCPSIYKLVKNLAVLQAPKDLLYEEVVKLVKDHYNPKPPVIIQRFKFNTSSQEAGESVALFVTALKELTQFCEFKTMFEEMIRDRIVCGLKKPHIQKRLLAEVKTYPKEGCRYSNHHDQNARDLQKPEPRGQSGLPVYKVSTASGSVGQRSTTVVKCYRCGDRTKPPQCRFVSPNLAHCSVENVHRPIHKGVRRMSRICEL